MKKTNLISIDNIILMGAKSNGLILFMSIISLRLQIWVTTLQNLYLYLIEPLIREYSAAPIADSCLVETTLVSEEVEMVMERIGFDCDQSGDFLEGRVIVNLFDENEPGLEEVKEAFNVFDKNRDGYIDAKELEQVICSLGFKEFTRRDFDRMIDDFDDNGDGFVDIADFLKLLHYSFLSS